MPSLVGPKNRVRGFRVISAGRIQARRRINARPRWENRHVYDENAVGGCFTTKDPIFHRGGLNLYQYCGNDPVNKIDRTGLKVDPVGATIAAISYITNRAGDALLLSRNPTAAEIAIGVKVIGALLSSADVFYSLYKYYNKEMSLQELEGVVALETLNMAAGLLSVEAAGDLANTAGILIGEAVTAVGTANGVSSGVCPVK